MQLYSVASGSSGNCIYAGDGGRGFLVDVGTSLKKVREGLLLQGLSLDRLDGILITHEHSDHISGLAALLRKYPLPVYATADTIEKIWEKCNMNNISPELFHSIRGGEEFVVSDYVINPFPISHDAVDPVCYTLSKSDSKVGIATDMGIYDDSIISALGDCDAVLLEANHDISLLQVGPYPYSLKMRILGDKGHLSNIASADLIKEIVHRDLKTVVLGHLSEHNNFPELAYNTVSYEMESCESWKQYKPELIVANRYEPTVPVAC
ncbi:MAG: MBL fold metallo-hydrolase [Eubacterium sp.]|nr:MBL fold metallo-hydrolase [Eubacterium sp.]